MEIPPTRDTRILIKIPLNNQAHYSIPDNEFVETDFEGLYLAVREHEKRVYTDDQVSKLPDIDPSHLHYSEWQVRKQSAGRLMTYLKKKKTSLKILEIGCGNGWLAAKLAQIPGAKVIAMDINHTEIEQACRVFKNDNLQFVHGTLNSPVSDARFDVIVFAAALPYFKSVQNTLQTALGQLYPNGEIHIIDTHFYRPDDLTKAIRNCQVYYKNMGVAEMAGQYFHHTWVDLNGFKYCFLFNPKGLIGRLTKRSPFYWISITN